MFRIYLILTVLIISFAYAPARAQETGKAFAVTAYAIDSTHLTGGNYTIGLWGIDAGFAPSTPQGLRARAYLDDFIGTRTIRCQMISTNANEQRARCLNAQERDLALQMIVSGYAAVNRVEVASTELATTYLGAENRARTSGIGLWADEQKTTQNKDTDADKAPETLFGGIPLWVVASGLLFVPIIGFLIVAVILNAGFRQLITLQKFQMTGTQKRERQLKEREKLVIASALEHEVMANRAKLDAFLVIYEELLKSLRDPAKTPKYQRAGDIIHEKPALTRTVYDAHIDKLDLLGPSLSSDLSALYASVVPNPDYKTLEPEIPIERAREMIDRIIRDAQRLSDPMDKVAGALAVIVRNKRTTTNAR